MSPRLVLSLSFALLTPACAASPGGAPPTEARATTEAATESDVPASAEPAATADSWATFTYAPGVTVEMPGTPVDAGIAGVFALKRGEGIGMSVQCMDAGPTKKARADGLAGMKRGVIGERKLLSENKVSRGSAEGYRLEIETETNLGVTRMHVLLLAGTKRLCNFNSMVSGSDANPADTERFLESARVD